ncbi:hypothetical protein DSO57_1039730 [Entomophthora muscae]|uniref:Uncharacterized protein n=1 Tax=Entomophthora muscae TaxID=34485 RepID=A0ACC2U8J8_9FUNG|nr:hypothetical protein DSO57_1039730 [Entomophthora muscae]
MNHKKRCIIGVKKKYQGSLLGIIITVMNDISILILKTSQNQELNPGPKNMQPTNPGGQGLSHPHFFWLKSEGCLMTRLQSPGDFPNRIWTSVKCAPPKVQTYAEAAVCLKEVKAKLKNEPSNKCQSTLVPSTKSVAHLAATAPMSTLLMLTL